MFTRRSVLAAASAAVVPLPRAAQAETPDNAVVMATRIDDAASFDPAEAYEYTTGEVAANCYQRLVRPADADASQIVGDLAESWEVSPDGRTFTFRLKPGCRFASGNAVTADDVAFSLRRAVVLAKSPVFILTQIGLTADNVETRVRAVNPQTLEIECGEAVAPTFFLYSISAGIGGVVERAVVVAHAQGNDLGNAWLKQNTAGSGPFLMRSWRASESITLDANPHAVTPPRIRRVVIRHLPEPATQLLTLQRRDVDIARRLGTEELGRADTDKDLRITSSPKASLLYVGLSQRHPALARPEVRQAIKTAIDYDAIQKNLVRRTYVVHQSHQPKGFPSALDERPFSRRLDHARALMRQAGFADGFEATLDYISASPFADLAQAIQGNLADIGIRVRMMPGEGRQVLSRYRARQTDMVLTRWGSDFLDPHNNVDFVLFNPDNTENSRTRNAAWRNGFQDAEVNRKILAAKVEPNPEKRLDAYRELQRYDWEHGPNVWLLQEVETTVTNRRTSGLHVGLLFDGTQYRQLQKA
ncbi:ABC transporter substrate-binding protein [Limobrevibacterium gyesilva]|uniref:ABC transporter substrate-binding protein n=1 Tax=Limobrevibacterium gyesilva TaxID=2991712 RepID=A0AA41YN08_9PROT|nr:ABC transporter substrate-binding protein [Limobrevibacterium gyesilva]MCW3473290.1 ABC transporter substrate-binding protein [Limobrevibacterium gyesilva]